MLGDDQSELADWLHRARGGDGAALGRLLERYRPYLLLLGRLQIGRRLQGKLDPADLVQDVFLAAARAWPGFRGATEAELLHWLRGILSARLANLLRHYLGTQRRDVRLERELAQELEQSSRVLDEGLFARESTPSQQVAKREQAVLLARVLERLPEDYREVLILRYLEGSSFADVADRMGRSVEAVKKLWARALARLRESLSEDL